MSAPAGATPFRGQAAGDELPNLRRETGPENVPTFRGRLPDPSEVVQWSGKPGLIYAFVSSMKLGQYIRDGWSQIRDIGVMGVEGPEGTVDIFVVSKGKPIAGADPANGIRPWLYDPYILEKTGLPSPYPRASQPLRTEPTPKKPTLNRA